jgi:hypothetical protein
VEESNRREKNVGERKPSTRLVQTTIETQHPDRETKKKQAQREARAASGQAAYGCAYAAGGGAEGICNCGV